ncbi:hypothetical protein GCM10008018_58610 [Paenibacillus marchantiophytorum]|uniref:Uncharacterized protein n=1 Tax=Paenibacillus marchantiophytorum TaxID=1619310 RepID=A0ABQ1FB99_9BACL|nr:hypothetical protein GCM10008018_58610 [Paenibacillus marchantiophytorum]
MGISGGLRLKFSVTEASAAKVGTVTLKNSLNAEVSNAEPAHNQSVTLTNRMMLIGEKMATLKI